MSGWKIKRPALYAVTIMLAVHVCRLAVKELVFIVLERTQFNDRLVSACVMMLLTALFVLIFKPLSVWPKTHRTVYILASVFVLALIASGPLIMGDVSPVALLLLVYSCVITPAFEEVIFRGYIWNVLAEKYAGWRIWLINSALFALWHLGYADSLALHVQGSQLLFALLMKAAVGLGFGLVLGALRLRTKNCYSTMLLHSVMNLFGR